MNRALWTCGVRGIGQVAKVLDARADTGLTRAFGSGRARQGSRGRQSREGGLKVTVKEQQRWRVRYEEREREEARWRCATCACNKTFSDSCAMRVCTHVTVLSATKQNVRATSNDQTNPKHLSLLTSLAMIGVQISSVSLLPSPCFARLGYELVLLEADHLSPMLHWRVSAWE